MFCNRAQSRKIVHYGNTDVCGSARIHRWKEICREGSSDAEKENRSHTLYFREPYIVESPYKIRKKKVLRFLINCKLQAL